jgi:hypothetical protein
MAPSSDVDALRSLYFNRPYLSDGLHSRDEPRCFAESSKEKIECAAEGSLTYVTYGDNIYQWASSGEEAMSSSHGKVIMAPGTFMSIGTGSCHEMGLG